jgi:phosphate:Na+ symporter
VGISIADLLNLAGSLGLFLVGMKVMSDSLMELAGNRLRRIMASLTSNRFLAAMTGFLVTGLIQSSSATTLMVVSFVNAGLLQLTESLGVIMGANIGTTLTAWLIAVLGFKVSMIDIALPLMIVGFVFYVREDRQASTVGGFIIGFALLFIGLEFMKSAIPNLESNEALMEVIQSLTGMGLWSLLLFAALGTILTLVLQSSSATMAITLVAVSQGWLPFDAACAIILGENIGTTITANMAAMVASTNARRAAAAHFVFNLIGVVWVLALFTPFLAFVAGLAEGLQGASPLTNPEDAPVGLAVFHTAFNVINTTLLIGFITPLAALVTRALPDRAEPLADRSQARYLDERSLKYPQTAIHASLQEARRLYDEPLFELVLESINVPPAQVSGSTDIDALVARSQRLLTPDLEDVAVQRLRPIYRQMVAYASRIHERHNLQKDEERQLRDVGLAARDSMLILGDAGQLNREMNTLMESEDENVRAACDGLRRQLLGFISDASAIDYRLTKEELEADLKSLDRRRKRSDKVFVREVGGLLSEEAISPAVASSLYTCSALIRSICKQLVRAERRISDAAREYDEVYIDEVEVSDLPRDARPRTAALP